MRYQEHIDTFVDEFDHRARRLHALAQDRLEMPEYIRRHIRRLDIFDLSESESLETGPTQVRWGTRLYRRFGCEIAVYDIVYGGDCGPVPRLAEYVDRQTMMERLA